MAITQEEVNQIDIAQQYREVYKMESVLGGLLGWERLVKRDKIGGEELHIRVVEMPEKIFVNGKEVTLTNH